MGAWMRRRRLESLQSILGNPTLAEVRQLSDDALFEALSRGNSTKTKKMLEAELRHREQWRSPSGKGFWISIVALAVSMAALAKSFWG